MIFYHHLRDLLQHGQPHRIQGTPLPHPLTGFSYKNTCERRACRRSLEKWRRLLTRRKFVRSKEFKVSAELFHHLSAELLCHHLNQTLKSLITVHSYDFRKNQVLNMPFRDYLSYRKYQAGQVPNDGLRHPTL